MNKATSIALPAALAWVALMVTGPAFGQAGYLSAGDGVATNSVGECWRGGFWTKSDAIEACDPDLVKKVVETAAVEVPAPRIVRKEMTVQADTQFGFDSDVLTPAGEQTLNELAATIRGAEEGSKITITGFTDRIGPEEHNMGLSKRRAEAVANYLASQGVSASQMEIAGMGPANPIVGCEGERGSALIQCLAPNRRTEIEFSAFELVEER